MPVVTWERLLFDDLKLTGTVNGTDYGSATAQTTLDILEPAHPMAGGLSGTVTVLTGPAEARWGVLASGGVAVASITGAPTQATVFGFDTGATLIDATAAPARRVGLFLSDFGPAETNSDGVRLTLHSICWAAGL